MEESKDEASSFYFDTALSETSNVIKLLLGFAKPGHVLFGSDFPYADEGVGGEFTRRLDKTETDEEVREGSKGETR